MKALLDMKKVKTLGTSHCLVMTSDLSVLGRVSNQKTFIYINQEWKSPIILDKPKNPSQLRFAQNNSRVIIQNTSGSIYIYETNHFDLLKKIQSNKHCKLIEDGFVCLNERNVLLCIAKVNSSEQVVAFDLELGTCHPITDFNHSQIYYNQYVEKEKAHLFTLCFHNQTTDFVEYSILKLKELDYSIEIISPSENLVWNAVFLDPYTGTYVLIDDNEVILLSSDLTRVIKRMRLPLPSINGLHQYYNKATLSNDGKFLAIAYSDCVAILDSQQLEIRVIKNVPHACFAEFSKCDQFLLIGTWEKGYILENNLMK